MSVIKRAERLFRRFLDLPQRIYRIQEALGRIEMRQVEQSHLDINESEYRVFSQWGEDGIIQHLVHNVSIERKIFVEFGVENYTESNTRFLLSNNSWSGLILDGNEENISYVKRDPIYWACNLKADFAFVTRENINYLITRNGIKGDIGLLSVDIDGNDYWVWEAITCISPRIVVCEYNSLFGPVARVTTPYDPLFVRDNAHFSKVYYGASAAALADLGARKGYVLVGGNSAGNNLFFVRKDLISDLKPLSPADAYRPASFREFHDETGNLTYDDFETRREKIKDLPLYDLSTNQVLKLKDIPGIYRLGKI